MKMYFSQKTNTVQPIEQDLGGMTLRECLEKTHIALDAAYAGFDNAVDDDLIDSYIYEINSLQKGTSISAIFWHWRKPPGKKSYAYIPRFAPWSAMFSVKVFLP